MANKGQSSDLPAHVCTPEWSHWGRDELIDKIKGVIYGQAIGDAYGLSTEFLPKESALKAYGPEGPKGYEDIIQDAHRMRWKKGDWTDDTDQLLLILQMVCELNGEVDAKDFARRLLHWARHGIEELGDIGGMGIGATVSNTLKHPQFLEDPHGAARTIWEKSGKFLAANGAIMRTAILGVLKFNDLEAVIKNTREICLVTHTDPRCVASTVAATTAIALLLQGKNAGSPQEIDDIVKKSLAFAEREISDKKHKNELRKFALANTLSELDLSEPQSIGYTFKCLGAGFYGLRKGGVDFRGTIRDVVMEAGDADTNGAVCGALLGCVVGFSALPEDLLAFPHREWLDNQVEKFLEVIGLGRESRPLDDKPEEETPADPQ